jgi:uncharacterized membrane-anchored protein YitT (DUF2179 family)
MKSSGGTGLFRYMKATLDILMILGIAIIIALPFVFRLIPNDVFDKYFLSNSYVFSLIFVEICGILIWIVLNEIRKIFKSLSLGEPFIKHNVLHLKRSAWLFLVLSVLFLIKTVVNFTLLSPVLMIAFFVACLFCRVLAEVFDKAILVKNENDLTI